MNWGFKGNYRFFRSHTLRKFHASIGLPAEYIDSLQGRSKNVIHETYIKTNPEKLKEIYQTAMHNVMIYNTKKNEIINQEFTIVINVFLRFWMIPFKIYILNTKIALITKVLDLLEKTQLIFHIESFTSSVKRTT